MKKILFPEKWLDITEEVVSFPQGHLLLELK